MEEIQQIKGWETTTQTDLYKQIHNQNYAIKPIKQRNINRDQNGLIQRNYQKKLIMKIQAQVKKNMTFQQQQNSFQGTSLEPRNIEIKREILTTGLKNQMKQEVQNFSQEKNKCLKQFQYEQKKLREELKRKYIKRRSIISDTYKVPFVNQYFLTQKKQQKKNKENFDNKELVFCSTMMQKQRSQRIQNIYYKSKSKNKKNQFFFLQSTEKLKKISQQSFQQKKQLILQNSKAEAEESVQKNKSANILLRKNGKKLHKTKLKRFNQSQAKIKINFQTKVKQNFQILMKDRFKYFPTIFKTDKSCQKQKSHRNKNINENQPLQKLHRRNSSQNIKSKHKDNNRILARLNLNQNTSKDQFDDHLITQTQMRQKSCLTTFINT